MMTVTLAGSEVPCEVINAIEESRDGRCIQACYSGTLQLCFTQVHYIHLSRNKVCVTHFTLHTRFIRYTRYNMPYEPQITVTVTVTVTVTFTFTVAVTVVGMIKVKDMPDESKIDLNSPW